MKALAERVAPASAEAAGEIVGACDRAGEKVSIVGGNTLEGMSSSARARRRHARRHGAARRRGQRTRRSHPRRSSGHAAARRSNAPRRAGDVRTVRRAAAALRNGRWYAGRRMGRSAPPSVRTYARLSHRIDRRPRRRNDRPRRRHGGEERRRLRHEPVLRRALSVRSAFWCRQTSKRFRCRRTRGVFSRRFRSGRASAPPRSSPVFRFVRRRHSSCAASIKRLTVRTATKGAVFALIEGSDALLERSTLEIRSALGRAGVPETRVIDAGARASFERVVDAYVACLGERSVTYGITALAERRRTLRPRNRSARTPPRTCAPRASSTQ